MSNFIAGLKVNGAAVEKVKQAVSVAVAEAIEAGRSVNEAKVKQMLHGVLTARYQMDKELDRYGYQGQFVTLGNTGGLTVTEGGNGTVSVKLARRPSASVTVSISVAGDPSVSVSPTSMTFTTTNYGTNQTLTVSAGQDSDSTGGSARVVLLCSGGGYDNVVNDLTVSVSDDD